MILNSHQILNRNQKKSLQDESEKYQILWRNRHGELFGCLWTNIKFSDKIRKWNLSGWHWKKFRAEIEKGDLSGCLWTNSPSIRKLEKENFQNVPEKHKILSQNRQRRTFRMTLNKQQILIQNRQRRTLRMIQNKHQILLRSLKTCLSGWPSHILWKNWERRTLCASEQTTKFCDEIDTVVFSGWLWRNIKFSEEIKRENLSGWPWTNITFYYEIEKKDLPGWPNIKFCDEIVKPDLSGGPWKNIKFCDELEKRELSE